MELQAYFVYPTSLFLGGKYPALTPTSTLVFFAATDGLEAVASVHIAWIFSIMMKIQAASGDKYLPTDSKPPYLITNHTGLAFFLGLTKNDIAKYELLSMSNLAAN